MANVKLSNVIRRAQTKVDKDNTDLIFYVGGEHIESENIRVHSRGIIAESTIGPMFYYGFKAGDFLLVSRNPHLKKAGLVDFDGICSEKTFVLETADSDVLLPEFLPFVLQNERFWDYAYRHRHGSTNTFVNWSTLANYEFELPDLETQRKLADVLWSINDTMDAYKKLISATDELVKSQFMGMIQTAEKYEPLLDHVDVLYGFPFNSKLFNTNGQGVPLLRIRDINSGFSDTYTTEVADEQYFIENGDCVVGMDGNFEIVKWSHGQAYLNQRVCKFTPKNIKREYMIRYLRSTLKQIEEVANSTTVKHLSAKDIRKMMLPIVSPENQEWFEEFSLQSDKSKYNASDAMRLEIKNNTIVKGWNGA